MTCATPRSTSPAAAPWTARGAAALPNDPGLHAILADPKLSSTAKALITVMVLNWARFKDHCWPSDATLAAKIGMSVGHVQRCLRELERAGRIFREGTAEVPNGRRIWLLWRCPGGRAGAQRTSRHRECAWAPGQRASEGANRRGRTRHGSRPGSPPRWMVASAGWYQQLVHRAQALWRSRHPRRTPLVDKAPVQPPRLLCQTCPAFVHTA